MVKKKAEQIPQDTGASSNGSLVPAVETPEWAVMPEGKPEEFGLTPDATHLKKQIWNRQELFLSAYRRCGKIGKAATMAGMTRWGVIHWQRHDVFEFKSRLDMAHADYCESIEDMIDDRLEAPQGNRGSDPLLMFRAKAEMPEKYREEVKVITNDAPALMWKKLKELAAKSMPAIEGEVREVDDESGDGGSGVLV